MHFHSAWEGALEGTGVLVSRLRPRFPALKGELPAGARPEKRSATPSRIDPPPSACFVCCLCAISRYRAPMLSRVRSAAVLGIDAYVVDVEVDIAHGLPSFATVGLPHGAVKEGRERVNSAITNSGYSFPLQRITVNLAPADVRKDGSAFDLPVALGVLAATGQLASRGADGADLEEGSASMPALGSYLIVGELGLEGDVRPVRGALSIALGAREAGFRGVIVPAANLAEAGVVDDVEVLGAASLHEVVEFLANCAPLPRASVDRVALFNVRPNGELDLADVRGQEHAKRALEVAAAGGHNLLMVGPPGSGKTMLARRLPTILPEMNLEEALETTKIHSVAGMLPPGGAVVTARPFRAPHHTISDAGLIGGGSPPPPGRGEPRAWRRAIPGRIARVPKERARGPAPTDGRRFRYDRARGHVTLLPRALHARGRHEPVPVRLLR